MTWTHCDIPVLSRTFILGWLVLCTASCSSTISQHPTPTRSGMWAWRGEPGQSELVEVLKYEDMDALIGKTVIMCGAPYRVKSNEIAIRVFDRPILVYCETQLDSRADPLPAIIKVTGELVKYPDSESIDADFPWGTFAVCGDSRR